MADIADSPRLTFARPSSRTDSPSKSPTRHQRYKSRDDFRDLSPSTILLAFAGNARHEEGGRLSSAIQTATAAEKELGLRVARAAKRLQAWCDEVQQWGWAGTFETPDTDKREAKRRSLQIKLDCSPVKAHHAHVGDVEYWGSLPAMQVEAYEERLDAISEELGKLDLDNLKETVLGIHVGRPQAEPGYKSSMRALELLDDFSLLVSQTLLQALPNHATLKQYIETWSVRLLVLREVSHYLSDLQVVRKAFELGWDATAGMENWHSSTAQGNNTIDTIDEVLKDKLARLGTKLDHMLDLLEGREDRLPEQWIDGFEELEADYGRWIADAQRRMFELDMLAAKSPLNAPNAVLKTTRGSGSNHFSSVGPEEPSPHTAVNAATPDTEVASAATSRQDSLRSLSSPKPQVDGPEYPFPQDATKQNSTRDIDTDLTGGTSTDDEAELAVAEVVNVKPSLIKRASMASIESFSPGSIKSVSVSRNNSNPSMPGSSSRRRSFVEYASISPSNSIRRHSARLSFLASPLNSTLEESSSGRFEQAFEISETASPQRTSDASTELQEQRDRSPSPSTPNHKELRKGNSSSSLSSLDHSEPCSPTEPLMDSPSIPVNRRLFKAPKAPFNLTMAKQRRSKNEDSSLGPSHIPSPVAKAANKLSIMTPPTSLAKKRNTSDELDRQISVILTSIPAPIRLYSISAKGTKELTAPNHAHKKSTNSLDDTTTLKDHKSKFPNYLRAGTTKTRSSPRPASPIQKTTGSPALTLSPAPPSEHHHTAARAGNSNASSHHASDSQDIKLYHLTQPGVDKPIKLFIRRVGENGERVMVRVGGGWADLGEYLRQYVEHHGRRTVSGSGAVEILAATAVVPASMPGGVGGEATARPESAMEFRVGRTSLGDVVGVGVGGGGARDSIVLGEAVGTPVAERLVKGEGTECAGTNGGAVGAAAGEECTPRSVGSVGSGDGSVGSGSGSGSGSKAGGGGDVGLMGPTAAKKGLSEEKLDWIEGMVEHARRVSGGKVGTSGKSQRVFLKGSGFE